MEKIISTAVEEMVKQFVENGGLLSKKDRENIEALRDICNNMLGIDASMFIFNEWKKNVYDEEET